MRTADFDYDLPESYIAQAPADPRDSCKLMVVHKDGALEHRIFRDVIDYLNPGDLLVVNETRVLPARLLGNKVGTGGAVECLLLNKSEGAPDTAVEQTWECLVKPGKRLKPGALMEFKDADGQVILHGEVTDILPENGARVVRLTPQGNAVSVDLAMHLVGRTPLPPYITEKLEDKERYQTVYSDPIGSAAAPTAGLHFTNELLDKIRAKGVNTAFVTLHVGLGTFRPVKVEDFEHHIMHTEHYMVPKETAELIKKTKAEGHRVIAVGTTSCRTLESVAAKFGEVREDDDNTSIFIYPGFEFKVLDGLITNFHLPESTLIMLVSAFAGYENVMHAYKVAVEEKYRFFSFGDCCLFI